VGGLHGGPAVTRLKGVPRLLEDALAAPEDEIGILILKRLHFERDYRSRRGSVSLEEPVVGHRRQEANQLLEQPEQQDPIREWLKQRARDEAARTTVGP